MLSIFFLILNGIVLIYSKPIDQPSPSPSWSRSFDPAAGDGSNYFPSRGTNGNNISPSPTTHAATDGPSGNGSATGATGGSGNNDARQCGVYCGDVCSLGMPCTACQDGFCTHAMLCNTAPNMLDCNNGSPSPTSGGTSGGTSPSPSPSPSTNKGNNNKTPTTSKKKKYIVKHIVVLRHIKRADFNANAKIKRSFVQTVSKLLRVDIGRIQNVRACKIGATEAECPGDVSADTSAFPTAGNGGNARRLTDDNDSQVRYEIFSETSMDMDTVRNEIMGPVYQSQEFGNALKHALQANGVDSSVIDAVSAKAGSTVEEEIRGGEDPEQDNSDKSKDAANNKNSSSDHKNDDSGYLMFIVGLALVVFLVVVIGCLLYKLKRRKHKTRRRRSLNDQDSITIADSWDTVHSDSVSMEMTSSMPMAARAKLVGYSSMNMK